MEVENHGRAHEWANNALMLDTPCGQVSGALLRGAVRAALFSVAARASEGLGLVRRAIMEMAEAVRRDPGDSDWVTELVRLKEQIGGDGDL